MQISAPLAFCKAALPGQGADFPRGAGDPDPGGGASRKAGRRESHLEVPQVNRWRSQRLIGKKTLHHLNSATFGRGLRGGAKFCPSTVP